MRALRILPLLLVAMTYQAGAQSVAQSVADAATTTLPVARADDRVVTRPADSPACTPWLGSCIRDDNSRMLLFLSVIAAGKRPLVLR